MKVKERDSARRLRKDGLSVREIARKIFVSKGSVSVWVRDIKLTPSQEKTLIEKSAINPGRFNAARVIEETAREKRRSYEEEGRHMAKGFDWLTVAGAMLYWGEGFKDRNTVGVANSDPCLLKLFKRFLVEKMGVSEDEIVIRIQGYVDDTVTLGEIEQHWLEHLSLKKHNLRSAQIDCRPISSVHKGKGRTLRYGVCRLTVNRTDVLHRIYGMIEELGGIEKGRWLR